MTTRKRAEAWPIRGLLAPWRGAHLRSAGVLAGGFGRRLAARTNTGPGGPVNPQARTPALRSSDDSGPSSANGATSLSPGQRTGETGHSGGRLGGLR